jgi:predicted amidohydrolase YtcJ
VMPPRTLEDRLTSIRAGIEDAHRLGVTSVQNAGSEGSELAAFHALRSTGELKLRVYQSIAVPGTATDADLARLDDTRRQYGDDPVLKTGAVEITADGLSHEALARVVGTLDRRGWQVWIRAQSSQAVQLALGAFHAAAQARPDADERRHRIQFAGTISPEDAERFSRLRVIASAPSPDVAEALVAANSRVTLGSGWPLAPLDPRAAIRAAIMRSGEGLDISRPRAFSLKHAVDAITSGAAYASFDEQRKGTLAPGMLADIAILSADIFATPPDRLMDVTVNTTIFDGAVVYTRPD